ncbi:MAG: hypothetical protein U0105_13440 [Candidatus Obscuribacterales bacterium]
MANERDTNNNRDDGRDDEGFLLESLRELNTLERALRVLESQGFPLNRMDVVAQDEFSHDVLVPFPEGARCIALGVT